jgi:hypothetical protein
MHEKCITFSDWTIVLIGDLLNNGIPVRELVVLLRCVDDKVNTTYLLGIRIPCPCLWLYNEVKWGLH